MTRTLAVLALFCCWSVNAADEVLWRDPGPVEQLDFASGPGGPEMVPKPPFQFIKEDLTGTQPKVQVTDANGRKWVVKFGMKVHAEPFAGRIAWACGYFVEPIHFVASGKILGVKHLKRAAKDIREDGTFEGARFQVRDPQYEFSKTYNWSWHNNPFIGTRQLQGLKILLMLTSNWDNKDATMQDAGPNTGIFVEKQAGTTTYIYSFYDWGGTMGRWGLWPLFRVWDCKAYAEQTKSFVTGVDGDEIRFGYFGRDVEDLRRGVRVTDAAWLMQYLGRITDQQLRTGLIASGATETEVECFRSSIRERINQLARVARPE